METNEHRHISGGLGEAENFAKPKTERRDSHAKANREHMAKLFRGERMGRNTDEKED